MAIVINGDTGITSVDGSAAAPSVTGTDTDTGIVYATNTVSIATNGTARLQVDSSGNVGINNTSPSTFGKFVMQVQGTTTPTNATNIGPASLNLYAAGNGSSTDCTMGVFGWMNGTPGIGSGVGFSRENSSDWGSQIRFYTHPTTTSNIGDITERMRIDSSGNLLVGTTSANGRVTASLPNATTSTVYTSSSVTTAGTSWYHYVGQSGNGSSLTTNNILIYGNGNIQNTNNSYGAISDVKLKENIIDTSPKLEKLCQVRVVNYNLKDDYEQHKQIGVIAQELEQVFPSMVDETVDRDAEGNDLGTTTKSVKYSVFVPMLIKAIQEQQAIIQQLQADVAALKGA